MIRIFALVSMFVVACDDVESPVKIPEGEVLIYGVYPNGEVKPLGDELKLLPVWFGLEGSAMARMTVRADHLAGSDVDFNCWLTTENWSSLGIDLRFNMPQHVIRGEIF